MKTATSPATASTMTDKDGKITDRWRGGDPGGDGNSHHSRLHHRPRHPDPDRARSTPTTPRRCTSTNTPSTTLVIEKYIEGTTTPLEGVTFLVTESAAALWWATPTASTSPMRMAASSSTIWSLAPPSPRGRPRPWRAMSWTPPPRALKSRPAKCRLCVSTTAGQGYPRHPEAGFRDKGTSRWR